MLKIAVKNIVHSMKQLILLKLLAANVQQLSAEIQLAMEEFSVRGNHEVLHKLFLFLFDFGKAFV